jgi:hypothetical protein
VIPHFHLDLKKILSGAAVPYLVFSIVFLFQILLLTRAGFLYRIIEALFFGLLIYLAALCAKAPRRTKIVILVLAVVIIGLRLPFLLRPDGLITTSDNALDALQSMEIRDNHTLPFFLLDAVKHMGTIKYLFVSFLWDLFGVHYLFFVLVQLAMFSAILFFLYASLKTALHPKTLLLFIVLNFAFIETVFDNSLSIRAGSYIEMLFFFFFGVFLFDWEFKRTTRMFLSYTFIFFSIYLHPLAALFAASFLACTFLFSLSERRFFKNMTLAAAGGGAGLFHWFYYLIFLPKPVDFGGWEKIDIRPLSSLSVKLLGPALKSLGEAFRNIFSFEFSYLITFFKNEKVEPVAIVLNRAVLYLSAAVAVAALVLCLFKICRWIFRKEKFAAAGWIYLFTIVLWLAYAAKLILVAPPLLEPRHNFDLVFLVIFSYLIVISRIIKMKYILSARVLAVGLLLAVSIFPHYFYYLKNAEHKVVVYKELLTALHYNRVKYLETDFIIAYPIHFLSHRKILVSDSLGPFTIKNFYPRMRDEVDALPHDEKAYLVFNDEYPRRDWHIKFTKAIVNNLRRHFQEEGAKYRTFHLTDFTLFVPRSKLSGK